MRRLVPGHKPLLLEPAATKTRRPGNNKADRPSSGCNPYFALPALLAEGVLPAMPETIPFPSSSKSLAACLTVSYRRREPTLSSPICCRVLFLIFLVFLCSCLLVFLPSSVANNPTTRVPK